MALEPRDEERAILSGTAPAPIGPSTTAATLFDDTELPVVQLSQWELVWRRLRRHHLALIGMAVLGLLVLMAVFAPLISPESYYGGFSYAATNIHPRLTYPGASDWKYLLGTDGQGHSMVMWIAYGARVSLSVGIIAAILTMAIFIHAEAAIDFLGVGIKPPSVSWGLALSNSQQYFGLGNWWWAFFPGLLLLITTLAINFLGDGLRDALDVRTGS